MSTTYSLQFKNESTVSGSVCVYQKLPGQEKMSNLYSLAWFSKYCHPNTILDFHWTVDYSFVWSETGELVHGVVFKASQNEETDPYTISKNSIGFTRANGAYKFAPPSSNKTTPSGLLGIYTDETIPTSGVSIGIGMSKQPAFAVNATPNFDYTFQPHPEYWVAFGDFMKGQVIDLNMVSTTLHVPYPTNVNRRKVSIGENNLLSIVD